MVLQLEPNLLFRFTIPTLTTASGLRGDLGVLAMVFECEATWHEIVTFEINGHFAPRVTLHRLG